MTRMIIKITDSADVKAIKDIADKLELAYSIEEDIKPENYSEIMSRISRGINVNNFGDPSQWQKTVRADRNLMKD